MKFYGQAEQVARNILHAFEQGDVPSALAQAFIRRSDDVPCRHWSWNNQLITALFGHSDARGFRQWQEVGRRVREGERAFYILAPLFARGCSKTVESDDEAPPVIYGFRAVPVFGLTQTVGEDLPQTDSDVVQWISTLPLIEVARAWGLSVQAFSGRDGSPLGKYRRSNGIAVGTGNLSTWAHELVHAADDRNGFLVERGQHWRAETVAELGGAVLLECLGYGDESDRGGCWQYISAYANAEGIDAGAACLAVIDRTCRAVARILEEAEALNVTSTASSTDKELTAR